jgi:aminoglycoside phosphotransferase (APT) family kinase protein
VPDERKLVRDELSEVFGEVELAELRHPNQCNVTWSMTSARTWAIVKQYRWLTPDEVGEVLRAEALVAAAGVPVPEVLHRCQDGLSVAYRYVDGTHLVPSRADLVDECASLFVRQLTALDGFVPSWQRPRPAGLPRRARQALDGCRDERLSRLLLTAWAELCRLAEIRPVTASHIDWRSDNILFADGRACAVLDWEGMVLLPPGEAVGYAASSLTHTWRDDLYQPLTLPPVVRFLETAGTQLDSAGRAHARLAARYACAIRLAEDRAAGGATVSMAELSSVFGS